MTDQKQTDGSGLKTLEDLQRTVLIRIVDDDAEVRDALSFMLSCRGWQTAAWGSAEEFLKAWRSTPPGCLLLDIRMPGMTGLDLQRRFVEAGSRLPVIFLTGHGDVATAVHTMKYGALDFLEKRGDPMVLAAAVERACKKSLAAAKAAAEAQSYQTAYDALTPREREVFVLAAKGLSNKEAAEVLGIGAETVKMHKANAYAKLGVQSSLEAYQWLENLPTPQPKDVA